MPLFHEDTGTHRGVLIIKTHQQAPFTMAIISSLSSRTTSPPSKTQKWTFALENFHFSGKNISACVCIHAQDWSSVYAPGPLALINATIFLRVQDAFQFILNYGPLKPCTNCSHQYEERMTLIYIHLIHFPFLYFQWKSLKRKKAQQLIFS